MTTMSFTAVRVRWPALRRVLLACVALILLIALLMTRPWATDNSWRQLSLFSPSTRIHNFRTMHEVFPARAVRHGSAPHRFERAERPLPASFAFQGAKRSVGEFLDRTTTTGLLVLRGNTILTERYFRGTRQDTPLTSWSVAKSFVSLLIGIARDQRRIGDLSTRLEHYVPELRGSPYGRVSLRDALTMSSGIAFSEVYDDPFSDIRNLFARIFYWRESAAHYLATLDAQDAPGSRFHYISSDTLALGLALRGAVHQSLTSYLEQEIWRPLGMEHDATWNVESAGGAELGFCCLNVTLRDYAKIGRLWARGGDWDGKRIVSAAWLHEATHPDAVRAPGSIGTRPWGYQYQFWIPSRGRSAFMAAGVWSQFIYVDPERELVIVKTSVDPEFEAHGDEHVALFEAIADTIER
jgi:CubicO group peptidase (beta-lactamase class C family)